MQLRGAAEAAILQSAWFQVGSDPGGVLELFFDGVSGPRSGTPTHI